MLAVIAIISLLLAMLMPALRAARLEGSRAKCLGLLKGLAEAGMAYAADDQRGLILPAHPIADVNPDHDEGFYDYGGATGAANVFGGTRYGPTSQRTAATRPMNRFLAEQPGEGGDYSAFRCPGDDGWPAEANYRDPDFIQWDDALTGQSAFASFGTSYLANAGRVPPMAVTGGASLSFTPYLRPLSRFPTAHETVVFCESVFWLAVFNAPGPFNYTEATQIDGWHGPTPKFNAALADGHAETVSLRFDHGISGQPGIPAEEQGAVRALWYQQPGWRLHCRPDDLILDRPIP